jgi:hypothetical protein
LVGREAASYNRRISPRCWVTDRNRISASLEHFLSSYIRYPQC